MAERGRRAATRGWLAAALLAFALCLPALAQERDWQPVQDSTGLYRALLPGKADGYDDVTASRPAAGHNVELDGGSHYFEVHRLEARDAPADRSAHGAYLRSRIEASVAAASGTLMSLEPVAADGFVGSEAIVDFPAMGGRVRQRHFVVGRHIVQQTWSGPPGEERSPDVEQFFASLKLLP